MDRDDLRIKPSSISSPGASEVVVSVRKTGRTDVWVLLEVYIVVELQYCDIIVQGTSVEFGVDDHVHYVAFDVRVEFDVVVDVPLAETSSEVSSSVSLDAVSRGEDVTRTDKGSTANVDALARVLLQDGHLPRVLAWSLLIIV